MEVNLISDTVTKPSRQMLEAMLSAEVGDDVFRQDPTVNALEEKVADMFGHDAALFCPSGTMTNQIAIRTHTRPLDEIICESTSHIYLYELGGYSFNSGVGIQVVQGQNGKMTARQVTGAIRPVADWYPRTRLVTLENSCNRAGGSYYNIPEIEPISELCRERDLRLHLDGARLFNVLVETGESPREYGKLFDSVSVCLSKGLGAPVGSVLTGSQTFINTARKVRKVLGGGMRQAGYLAAAGIYALDNNVTRLATDNERARQFGRVLKSKNYIEQVLPVHTNIVIFKLREQLTPEFFLERLGSYGIHAAPMSHDTVRFVLHLDVTDAMIKYVHEILGVLESELYSSVAGS